MKSKLLYFFLFPIIAIAQPATKNVFSFQLNHIDIAVDSVTLRSLMNNKFTSDTFSSTKLFRDSTGIEILVRGQDHWLHFLPDEGFYKHRLGAAVLVHENFTWIETDTIIKHLQGFTEDSLYNRPYTSGGENTAHIHIYENLEDSLSLLKFIPQLQNFRKSDYISWGYTEDDLANGISQKRNMQDYVGKETSDKLFKSIESIKVTVSRDELRRIPPLMRGYGYKRAGNKFSLKGSPLVTMKHIKKNKKQIFVHLKLAKAAATRTISFSNNAQLIIEGYNAWFNYRF
jgi:hypothetical protein